MMTDSVAPLDYDFSEPRQSLRAAAALWLGIGVAAVGLGVFALRDRHVAAPDFARAPPPPSVQIATKVAASPYGALIDPVSPAPVAQAPATPAASSAEVMPVPPSISPLLDTAPLPPKRDSDQAEVEVPLPPMRPAEFARAPSPPPDRHAQPVRQTVAAVAPPDTRNFLEKLLGIPQAAPTTAAPASPTRGARETNTTVAYAAPAPVEPARGGRDWGIFGGMRAPSFSPTGHYDQYTAVYDISAHMVYLPDGTRLEAHSGLGDHLDDPRHVADRMRGATPPHVYELTAREGSFHGVQALRLNPVGGDGGMYGRDGLLAHPFMLGPNGDSNGCVSFRDYDTFLRAYQTGRVKTLVVVANAN